MRDDSAEAVDLFREELVLCEVEADQTVAILAPEGRLHDRSRGFVSAARSLGAYSYVLMIPDSEARGTLGIGHTELAGRVDLVELLKKADIVVDIAFIHFSQEQLELLASGTRILACIEPLDMLARLFPTRQLRAQVEAAGELLGAASESG